MLLPLLGVTLPLVAQEKELTSPPHSPYLVNAPTCAMWTILCKPKGAAAQASPQQRWLKEIRVIKMGETRQEIQTWSDGLETQRWIYRGMILSDQPGSPDVYILRAEQLRDLPSADLMDYSKSDFPELNWVSAGTYAGVERYGKRPCYHYRRGTPREVATPDTPARETPEGQAGIPQVWIDGSTKLPAAADDGVTLQIFSFQEIPRRELVLPPRFEKALQEASKTEEGSNKHQMVY